jgi:uncharacterized protein DUF3352
MNAGGDDAMTDLDRTSTTETETTSTPVPTTTIQPPSSAAPARNSRVRWLAAGVLIALVAAITGLAAFALTSSKSTSAVLGFVPTDSVAYGELRLDLPGDQRQEVGEFLSKFPGFADQAALDTKLDEVLDRLVSEGSGGKQSYSKDVKPWFGGQMGFAAGPIHVGGGDASGSREHRGLLLLSIKDAALANTWLTSTLQEAGATGTQETYNGAQLTVFAAPKMPEEQAAFTIADGKVALVGDLASVKAAVDTKGSSALATGDAVEAAQASVTGDSLGFVFVDMKAIVSATAELAASAAPAGSMPPIPSSLTKLVPDWAAARVRVEGDALRLDSVAQHKEGTPGPDENRANVVTGFAPPSTIALVAGNDYGATLHETLELYENDPALKSAYEQIDQLAGMLGGLDAIVGWMGDTGIVVDQNGEVVEGGLVSVPADAAQARQLFTTLRSFAQLAGGSSGITITDETYNGQTITVIDLGDLSGLAGMAGAIGGTSLPAQPSGLPGADVKIAYVANDDVVAIGSSTDFVKHVLDAGAGASLADDARFQSLLGRVDAKHSSVSFVDVAAIRGVFERLMADASATDKAEYEGSVKPFLTPFDALIGTGVVSSSTDQMHTLITVK